MVFRHIIVIVFVTSDGIRLNYETAGDGDAPPALFLHGWGGSLASFKGAFKFLKTRRRVFNVELPGFGLSPPPPRPFSIGDYAAAVAEFIEKLCGGRAVLIAHSFGGRVALYLAAERPDAVAGAVLIDSAGLKPRRGIRYYSRVFRYKILKSLIKAGLRNPRAAAKYGSADFRALNNPVMRATFIKTVNENLKRRARLVKCPTLILWGGRDRDTPPYMARKLRRLIRGCNLVIFPRAGHYSHIDEFRKANALMSEFLSGL